MLPGFGVTTRPLSVSGGGVVAQLRGYHVDFEAGFALDLAVLGRKQIEQAVAMTLESVGDLTDHPRPQFVINGPD
jgi:hypothetical protein